MKRPAFSPHHPAGLSLLMLGSLLATTLSAQASTWTGQSYLAPGRPAETDLVQAGLGLDWRLSRRLVFSADAGLAEGKNTRTVSDLSTSLRWSF